MDEATDVRWSPEAGKTEQTEVQSYTETDASLLGNDQSRVKKGTTGSDVIPTSAESVVSEPQDPKLPIEEMIDDSAGGRSCTEENEGEATEVQCYMEEAISHSADV